MKIKLDHLFTQEMLDLVSHSSVNYQEMEKTFSDWTENEQSEIFSGYRKELPLVPWEAIEKLSLELRSKFSTLVVLGIGGSALGAQSLLESLYLYTDQEKKIHFIDNLDSNRFSSLLETIDLKKTAILCISKSGGTLESIAPLSYFLDLYKKNNLKISEHFYCVTDPTSGVLRKWAENNSIVALPVPSSVGGRFSVFTSVGLLPLAFANVDLKKLKNAFLNYLSNTYPSLKKDIFKLAHRLHELDCGGIHGHCLFIYSSQMRLLGEWYKQLWGESLGKIKNNGVRTGSFPLYAVGSTDQHSLLQYLADGPHLLTTCFLTVKNRENEILIGKYPKEFSDKLSFSEGLNWNSVLNSQATATMQSLIEKQKAVYQVDIDSQTVENLAELYLFWMDLVSILGVFYRINPYDQPGVERGKIILPEILGS